jgi:adenylosuccinate lyase
VAQPLTFTGAASHQVKQVAQAVADVVAAYPQAAAYQPGDIL